MHPHRQKNQEKTTCAGHETLINLQVPKYTSESQYRRRSHMYGSCTFPVDLRRVLMTRFSYILVHQASMRSVWHISLVNVIRGIAQSTKCCMSVTDTIHSSDKTALTMRLSSSDQWSEPEYKLGLEAAPCVINLHSNEYVYSQGGNKTAITTKATITRNKHIERGICFTASLGCG